MGYVVIHEDDLAYGSRQCGPEPEFSTIAEAVVALRNPKDYIVAITDSGAFRGLTDEEQACLACEWAAEHLQKKIG